MSKDPRTVYVSTTMTSALGEPQFLIEDGGKLYLTAAVLEYDLQASELRDLLASGEPVKAVRYGSARVAQFANTDPPDND